MASCAQQCAEDTSSFGASSRESTRLWTGQDDFRKTGCNDHPCPGQPAAGDRDSGRVSGTRKHDPSRLPADCVSSDKRPGEGKGFVGRLVGLLTTTNGRVGSQINQAEACKLVGNSKSKKKRGESIEFELKRIEMHKRLLLDDQMRLFAEVLGQGPASPGLEGAKEYGSSYCARTQRRPESRATAKGNKARRAQSRVGHLMADNEDGETGNKLTRSFTFAGKFSWPALVAVGVATVRISWHLVTGHLDGGQLVKNELHQVGVWASWPLVP